MHKTDNIPGNISEILTQFLTEEDINLIVPYGSGHINETYFVKTNDDDGMDYLLQRINHHVFKDVPALIDNIKTVTMHLKDKLSEVPGANPDIQVLTLVPTKNNLYYYQDTNNDYWRMYYFIHAKSYDVLENQQQAYEGGKAFGNFQAQLVDLDPKLIKETIPNFHHVKGRVDRFNEVLLKADPGRLEEAADEIAFVKDRAGNIISLWQELLLLPVRVIHNDTKFNNVLLDKNDRVQCVIDLDTVMPGYVAYDFGDAIRTIINTAAEDEKDLDKIGLNISFFHSYTQGYLEEATSFLTEGEVGSLISGVFLITYEQVVRFLTDYLENDVYYKIHFPEHNLQRTKAQIQLLKKLEAVTGELSRIIKNVNKTDKMITN